MKGRKIYVVGDKGKLEAYTNMMKVVEDYPVLSYSTMRRHLRQRGYYVKGRYEVWRMIIK